MIYKYDRALENKFKRVFSRTIYNTPDKIYESYLKSSDNKHVDLPIISIFRNGKELDVNNIITPTSIPRISRLNQDKTSASQVYSMPVSLSYQIDIWASSDVDRDDLLKEVIYFLVKEPYITLDVGNGSLQRFSIQIENPDDITDISSFSDTGDIYRESLLVNIPNAQYFLIYEDNVARFIDVKYDIE